MDLGNTYRSVVQTGTSALAPHAPAFMQAPLREMGQGLGDISAGLLHGFASHDLGEPLHEMGTGLRELGNGAVDLYVGYHHMLAEGSKNIARGVWRSATENPSSNYHPSTNYSSYSTGPN